MALSLDPIVDQIMTARIYMLLNQPFFGNLATRLKLVDASKWCDTAATDGRHFFYNREFIKSLNPKQLVFLLAHEVLHSVYDHMGRRGSRDPMIWNFANDYIVNYTLVNSIVKNKNAEMPSVGLYNEKYTDEFTSEEIYRFLEDEYKKNPKIFINMKTLDQHLELGEDSKDGSGKSNPDPGSETGYDYTQHAPVYSEEELEKIRQEMKAALISSSQVNTGRLPLGVERMIEQMVKPSISWRELLINSIQTCFRDDYTFEKPSRRSWVSGCIFPSQKNMETIDICISLDTSGSIGDKKFAAFLSEVQEIIRLYQDYRLHIWCIDAEIFNHQVFTPENSDEIYSYKAFGGGGNNFPLNWQHMEKMDLKPELFVIFSDGYPCGSWGVPDYCPTIFVIANEWDKKIEAPFGRTVYMDDVDEK
jgi:predicted metal-dependent peptidase